MLTLGLGPPFCVGHSALRTEVKFKADRCRIAIPAQPDEASHGQDGDSWGFQGNPAGGQPK
jgi:hypothetical protein